MPPVAPTTTSRAHDGQRRRVRPAEASLVTDLATDRDAVRARCRRLVFRRRGVVGVLVWWLIGDVSRYVDSTTSVAEGDAPAAVSTSTPTR